MMEVVGLKAATTESIYVELDAAGGVGYFILILFVS